MPRAALHLLSVVTCLLVITPTASLAEQATATSQIKMINFDLPGAN